MVLEKLLPPTEAASAQALAAARALAPWLNKKPRASTVTIRPENASGPAGAITVPLEAFELFLGVLQQMAAGNAVTIVPHHAELTTQQAADLLNVSRPFLIRLLKEGKVQYRTVGTHRRIYMSDLQKYREAEAKAQRQAAADLTAESQKIGLEY